MSATVLEQNEVPIHKTVDVLVAGGGPAGFAAALAAAREGAETLLVERFGYLGGMMTGSMIVAVLGVGDGVKATARGITEELRTHLEAYRGISKYGPDGDYWVDAEIFKWRGAEMLAAAGAEILLHTMVCNPLLENGAVGGVFTESKNGRRAIRAKVVVDCTADGDVACRAGAGLENKTHRVTLVVFLDGVDREKQAAFAKQDPERHQQIVDEAKALNGGFLPAARYLLDIDITDAEDLTTAELVSRRGAFAALDVLRAHMPGWENAVIRETCHQLGVRQSRLIQGLYTLTHEDMQTQRRFPDAVARLGKGYEVPYRCLVPRGIGNLLVAGRCISCDYEAAETLRLIAPCFATGQAAGTAAALAVRHGLKPDALPAAMLRDSLARQGVHLGEQTA